MISLIAAVSKNGVIGDGKNNIPWSFNEFPSDMKWFRSTTAGSTVIMGRKTFESMGNKPLPKRRNIVVTRSKLEIPGIESCSSLKEAVNRATASTLEATEEAKVVPKTFLIGGSRIYQEGLEYANEIFLTLIPKTVEVQDPVLFPWINPEQFRVIEYIKLEGDLQVAHYVRNDLSQV